MISFSKKKHLCLDVNFMIHFHLMLQITPTESIARNNGHFVNITWLQALKRIFRCVYRTYVSNYCHFFSIKLEKNCKNNAMQIVFAIVQCNTTGRDFLDISRDFECHSIVCDLTDYWMCLAHNLKNRAQFCFYSIVCSWLAYVYAKLFQLCIALLFWLFRRSLCDLITYNTCVEVFDMF